MFGPAVLGAHTGEDKGRPSEVHGGREQRGSQDEVLPPPDGWRGRAVAQGGYASFALALGPWTDQRDS